jgi:hypothetical protein
VVYTLGNETPPQLGWMRTNGPFDSQRIPIGAKARVVVSGWSRNGQLALRVEDAPTFEVMTVRLDSSSPPKALGPAVRIAEGMAGGLSPDGSWIAYSSRGSASEGPWNVFVHHLESGRKHQISIDGGSEPMWAASGRELFFRAGPKMMAVSFAFDGASARIGRPQTLFEGDYLEWNSANYDVSADGKQFVMVRTANPNTRTLAVRLHWTTELQRLAPSR